MDQRVIDLTRDTMFLHPGIRWRQLSGVLQIRLRCTREEADLLVDALAHDGHITIGPGTDPAIVCTNLPAQSAR